MRGMRQTHQVEVGDDGVVKRFGLAETAAADREWSCLVLLAGEAPGLAPRPLHRERRDGGTVIRMERVPGVPLSLAPIAADQLRALGLALARLHRVPLDAARAARVPARLLGAGELPGFLSERLASAADVRECEDPALVQAALGLAAAWLERPLHVPDVRLTGIGIADLNPANVLWDGRACRLVDFEDGGLTDRTFDLADHVEHLASRLHGVYPPDALAEAAGLPGHERSRQESYRRLWAIFWLLKLLPGSSGFSRNPAGTTENQARHVLALLG